VQDHLLWVRMRQTTSSLQVTVLHLHLSMGRAWFMVQRRQLPNQSADAQIILLKLPKGFHWEPLPPIDLSGVFSVFIVSEVNFRYDVLAIIFIAATVLVSLKWLVAYRRRAIANQCRNCDYNLTGNVSGVCPECGTPISSKGLPAKTLGIPN
jgi:hypothetical protein